MKTYRQKDITVQANSLEEAEVLILNELDSKCRVNEPLDVVEYNNGWIKIESEYDLPEKEFYKEYNTFPIDFKCNSVGLHYYFKYKEITHYQPIVKPLPPLY